MCIYMGVRKFGPFQFQKSGQSYTFFFKKKRAYHIPGGAKKGARTSILCDILGTSPSEV